MKVFSILYIHIFYVSLCILSLYILCILPVRFSSHDEQGPCRASHCRSQGTLFEHPCVMLVMCTTVVNAWGIVLVMCTVVTIAGGCHQWRHTQAATQMLTTRSGNGRSSLYLSKSHRFKNEGKGMRTLMCLILLWNRCIQTFSATFICLMQLGQGFRVNGGRGYG